MRMSTRGQLEKVANYAGMGWEVAPPVHGRHAHTRALERFSREYPGWDNDHHAWYSFASASMQLAHLRAAGDPDRHLIAFHKRNELPCLHCTCGTGSKHD